MNPDPAFRPSPPLAKRLNRNALTLAAVIMGMTVLTAVVVLSPGRGGQTGAAGAAGTGPPALPNRPTFLDEPTRGTALPPDSSSVGIQLRPPSHTVPDRQGLLLPHSSPVPEAAGEPVASSGRLQAFEAALKSPVLTGGMGRTVGVEQPTNERSEARPGTASAEQRLLSLGDSLTRASMRPPAGERSPSDRQRDFLTRAGDAGGTSVLGQLEAAGSPYTLRAGTVVPGVLVTGINSDLPGEIVGQVSRDVYDSRTQRLLLVPKGAKLIGTYDNQVAAGQGRLLVAWTRLVFPDGRSLKLPGLALKDPEGQTGAADRVDHHSRRVFGKALLLSAISAGAQLSQPRLGSILTAPSAGQVAAGAMGQELSNVALEILRRGMDVAPTITIRQGQPFLVFLNGDVVFDGPYQAEP